LYASTAPPFSIDQWWQEQLGQLELKLITEDYNLFLLAVSEDSSVDEKSLERYLASRYLSLFLQGVGYDTQSYPRGMKLFGDNTADGMRVKGLGRLDKHSQPPKVIPASLSEAHLRMSARLAQGIEAIFPENNWREEFLRLRKGFNAFLDGIKHHQAHNRLHQFVRALDAVIKPKQGDGTKKFKYRCQFFAGRKPDDTKLLGELYELRSAAEHLNPLNDKLEEYAPHERDKLKSLRTYQAELLAAFVYRKILLKPDIRAHFKNDQAVTDLWTKNDANALISFWGDTINLNDATKDHFHDYL
jgi:gamma-glutamylcyclotransferase (GGCT)/AIG2-like uncharacterized protein YtfP